VTILQRIIFSLFFALCSLGSVVTHAQQIEPLAPTASNRQPPPTEIEQLDNEIWQIPLARAGFNAPIRLSGQVVEQTLFLPVPEETDPQTLTTKLFVSSDINSGFLEFRTQNRLLAVYDLTEEQANRFFDVQVPLEGAPIQDGVLPLTISARLRSTDDVCINELIGSTVEMIEPSLLVDGTATPPKTVGQFFPSLLESLSIYLPTNPTAAEAESALRLSTAVARRYRGYEIQINTFPLDAETEPDVEPFERAIIIEQEADDAARLRGRLLQLTGTPSAILNNVSLLENRLSEVALDDRVQTESLQPATTTFGNRITFDRLNYTNMSVTGVGQLDLSFPVSQADLGGNINSMTVRIGGDYTPVPAGDDVTLSVMMNDVLLRSVLLDRSGTIDLSIPVPDNLIQRDNTLQTRFDYIPAGGLCKLGLTPFYAQIRPGSYVGVNRGNGELNGFERFPQSWVDGFHIAFESATIAELQAVSRLLAEMQYTTETLLIPEVIEFTGALEGSVPVLLVTSTGETPNAPIQATSSGLEVTSADGDTLIAVEANTPFATLQAFRDSGRDMMLLGYHEDDDLINRLVSDITADPLGWFGVAGDVLLTTPDTAPVSLNVADGAFDVQPLAQPEESTLPWRIITFVASGLAVVLLLALIYPRVVRSSPETI